LAGKNIILSAEEQTSSRIHSTFPDARDKNMSNGQRFFSLFLPSHCFCPSPAWDLQVPAAFGRVNSVQVSLCTLKSQSSFAVSSLCKATYNLLVLSVLHQIFPSLCMQSPDPSQSPTRSAPALTYVSVCLPACDSASSHSPFQPLAVSALSSCRLFP